MKRFLLLLTACSSAWRAPAGYKTETFKFPLDFAPQIHHRGSEALRFPPGMFDPKAPGYWAYAFTWRTEDAAQLSPDQLATELTQYFHGLVTAVDDKLQIANTISAQVTPSFDLSIHTYDAFTTKLPIDLVGHARRVSCGSGALWVFVVAPPNSPIRADLDALAAEAGC